MTEAQSPSGSKPDPRTKEQNGVIAATISHIRLVDLFGLYTYELPTGTEQLGRTPIVYGENGLGKTNILRIIFHLLSPAGNRGHRSALGKIKFRQVEIALSNDVIVSATRTGDVLEGAMRLEVKQRSKDGDELIGAWNWTPETTSRGDASHNWVAHLDPALVEAVNRETSVKARTRALQSIFFDYVVKESDPREGEKAFLRAIRRNVPPIYFLTADRVLISDRVALAPPTASDVEARLMRPEAMVTKGRERAINEAIALASRHLSQLGVHATQQGSRSMHSIYHDLLKRLASRATSKTSKASKRPESVPQLTMRLLDLSTRYDLYSTYALTPPLQGPALVELLRKVRPSERSIAAEVLRPYVESLTEQANNFADAYTVIDTLVSTVNGFLHDKSLSFAVGDGMLVRNKLGQALDPSDLSSGEQQLLLLFCHISLATDSGGIFIIDEPEISLNVRWQRRLVDALERLDLAKTLQFLLASHSIEILTRHRSSVFPLSDARSK